jgi:Cu/Ag efflux pump CusA
VLGGKMATYILPADFRHQPASKRNSSALLGHVVVVAAIFLLLYLTFHSFKQALLVIGNIPFALVGGIAALWLRGMNLNFAAADAGLCTSCRQIGW